MTIFLSEVGWTSLLKRREYYKFCQMYKIVNNLCPEYLADCFPVQRAAHNYVLRNNNIQAPQSRTVTHRKSFYPSAIALWNGLNDDICACRSLAMFKIWLRKHVFPTPNSLCAYGIGKTPVLLARMRMCLC